MRSLMKTGLFLMVLAAVLLGLSYNVLRAQGLSHHYDAPGQGLSSEARSIDTSVVTVKLDGPVDLRLKQGATPSIIVRAEQRLLSKIRTVQEGNTLRIDARGVIINMKQPMLVELTLPALQQLQVMGSGDVQANGFRGNAVQLLLAGSGDVLFNGQYQKVTASVNGSGDLILNGGNSDRVELSLQGSGSITASGASKVLTAKLSGSGDLNAQRLIADIVSVGLLGSSDASVFARNAVSLAANGSGDIRVYGKPARRSVSTSGSGEVSWE